MLLPKARLIRDNDRSGGIIDFQRIAEIEELSAGAGVGGEVLPVPEVVPHCTIIQSASSYLFLFVAVVSADLVRSRRGRRGEGQGGGKGERRGAGERGEGGERKKNKLTSPSNIIRMLHPLHPIQRLQIIDRSLVIARKSGIEVGDDGFDVCGAVFGHVLPDGLEVGPEVAVSFALRQVRGGVGKEGCQ